MTKPLIAANEDRHLFIVRVWREDSQAVSGGQWRGSVEHVPSGQRIHFLSLEAMTEFVSQFWGHTGGPQATIFSSEQQQRRLIGEETEG